MNDLVSIIIVNYNGAELLEPCLRSIEDQEYKNIEIILVDNASADNSIALVGREFPSVKIIRSDKNLGFAGGNNLGAQHAAGEYLVLLNNDTVVDKHWLTELLSAMSGSKASVVTSKVITEGVPKEFYEMNGTINYLGYNIMMVFSDLSQVFFAGGASIILRNDRTGVIFPDEYFLYHEDVFLSWLARIKGEQVSMCQGSIVHHTGSATTKKQVSSFSTFYQERNRLLNVLLFYSPWTLIRLIPYILADAVMKTSLSVLFRRKSFSGTLRSYGWIVSHAGWIGRQRRIVQSVRAVGDKEILKWMSYKVIDSDHPAAKLVNTLSKIYSSVTGLAYHE